MRKIVNPCSIILKGRIEPDIIFVIEQRKEEKRMRKINQRINTIKGYLSIF